MPFHENGRLAFQAYDQEVEELIPWCAFYCTIGRPIIFADQYFCFHTVYLHHLLNDFFKFLIYCLTGTFSFADKLEEDPFGVYESSWKGWMIDDYEVLVHIYNEITNSSEQCLPFEMIEGEPYFQ